ncbi:MULTISPECIES: BACON domain-containing protein [unclassified Sphingobacterium]|uniref:BACON domain-containing protein n=1 Tax=unclassified Sphingobacterium TaxID=2609468 RepID=UPI0025E591C0|nr:MULTISPECIES: BACON domain-containing protein [unclassified Sphingobacterium]
MKSMKTTYYYTLQALPKAIFAFCLTLTIFFSSCKDENEINDSLTLKDNPSKMESVADGSSQTFTVQSAGSWKVQPLRKEHWFKIDPAEGNGEGTFTVTVTKNTDQQARAMTLFFTVNGQLQSNVLKIEQAAATNGEQQKDPYLKIDGISEKLDVPEAGLTGNYILRATGKWRIAPGEDTDWVSISPSEGSGDTPVTIKVNKNTDIERTANLLLFLDEVQQTAPLTIYQKGVKLQVEGDVVLNENFSWLTYGSEIFSVTTGETRIGSWTSAEVAKGWTSTINTTEGGGSYASIYARPGFIKLGRTNYGGDLISPKLANVQRTKNLLVTFKAVRYASGDHNLLTVGVKGPGKVSVSEFKINNLAATNSNLESCRASWQAPEATYSFVITGATSETQFWLLGGAFDQRSGNWPSTVNRIFIDDVVVKVTK